MKKILISLLLSLALLLSLGAAVYGEARLDYVTDGAGLLTEAEVQDLQSRAARISEQYSCGVYIVVVDDYTKYAKGSIENFAETVFDSYGLGYGSSGDGVLLAMSMNDRDYDIYAHGGFGNYAFTDYGKSQLAESFLDDFARGNWLDGFRDYLRTSEDMIRRAKNNEPVDTWIPDAQPEHKPGLNPIKLLASLGVGCMIGGGTVGSMKRQMKTAVKQTRAEDYISHGGVELRRQSDDFVNRSVTQQRIPRSTSNRPSGGHYGGTTISGSHGGSHHSGKF